MTPEKYRLADKLLRDLLDWSLSISIADPLQRPIWVAYEQIFNMMDQSHTDQPA